MSWYVSIRQHSMSFLNFVQICYEVFCILHDIVDDFVTGLIGLFSLCGTKRFEYRWSGRVVDEVFHIIGIAGTGIVGIGSLQTENQPNTHLRS